MIRLDTFGRLTLHGADGGEVRSVLAQPKRLALLVLLSVESARGFLRRDHLFGLFWPELSQAHARQALRQSLYILRHALGEAVVTNRGAEEIGIAPGVVECDACEFERLLQEQRLEEALARYRGDFLAGFYVAGASAELEQWVDTTRDRLRGEAIDAAWALAKSASVSGDAREAARWGRFATSLAPTDERSLQRLVRLLDQQGDRAGALRAYAEFAQRLDTELEAEPSPETRALIQTIRGRTIAREPLAGSGEHAAPRVAASSEVHAAPVVSAHPRTAPAPPRHRRAYIAVAVALPVITAALLAWPGRRTAAQPVVAVGWVQDPAGADTAADVRALADLLATDLARIPGLRVVSRARLHDLLGQRGVRQQTPSTITDAARSAGANVVLEAVLSGTPDRTLRLDLRRVELATGTVSETRSVDAPSVFALADRATAAVAEDFGLRAPERPLRGVTTRSVAAERLYEEGLRNFYQGDPQTAIPLFHAALDEDSTFAMAAYYAGLGEQQTDGVAARRDFGRALRLANRESERERLLIRQAWAFLTNAPPQLAFAESLVTRFPDEPGGELALGRALAWGGDFPAAVRHLRRAVALDSLSLSGRSAWCRACDALDLMVDEYIALDSLSGAERVARWWTRLQPTSPHAWWRLESVLNREEAYGAARAAGKRAERLSPMGASDVVRRAIGDIRAGEFIDADRILTDETGSGNASQRGDALWWLVISLRNQGRLRAAAEVASLLVENAASEPESFSEPSSLNTVAVAQVQFEMGHFRRAAALFDSMSHYDWRFSPAFPDGAPGLRARHLIWMTTHVATARAAVGDTATLGALADSITVWKVHSALFRDQVLDFYVRGLLLAARGRQGEAAAQFRRAVVSPIDGYSRANFELAKIMLAAGRPREAIPLLSAPLHGWLEASNYYLTYTELHALLGEAFERAGERDSALVHYDRALDAWRHADPEFAPRIARMRARVRALRRPKSAAVVHADLPAAEADLLPLVASHVRERLRGRWIVEEDRDGVAGLGIGERVRRPARDHAGLTPGPSPVPRWCVPGRSARVRRPRDMPCGAGAAPASCRRTCV